MPEQKWILGSKYKDTASKINPEDQLLRWLQKADGISINNASGIRSLSFIKNVKSSAPYACLIFVASDLENPASGYWIDPYPTMGMESCSTGEMQNSRKMDQRRHRPGKVTECF